MRLLAGMVFKNISVLVFYISLKHTVAGSETETFALPGFWEAEDGHKDPYSVFTFLDLIVALVRYSGRQSTVS